MVSIDLNNSQRTMLTTLVNKYQQTGEAVTGEKIAEEIDRNPGTVRNQMQSLTSLGLVEGIPGPTGGYKPTPEAFDAIDRQQLDEAESVIVARDFDRVDVTVEEINLTSVHHPELCRARVHLQHSVQQFEEGQPVILGPTPISKLVIAGTVEAVDESNSEILLDIAKIEAPVEDPEK
ncbi:Rrf2 family transcriptional regulator [Haloarcula salina]|uniref:HTH domain-containing protein n=1 Tax=Haloarcula salina TaxID=1429914 RepID=A0AA41KLS5_9EURY|nr:Rrf2 family transcriptional regulator [Haloarcula salina]MBV0903204.1 HTH domain-containing protein [Haloarcula salina]